MSSQLPGGRGLLRIAKSARRRGNSYTLIAAAAPSPTSYLEVPGVVVPQHPATHVQQRPLSTSTPARSPRSALATALLVGAVGAGAYVVGSLYPPAFATMVKPREAPPAPSSSSDEGILHTAQIEKELMDLPLVRKLLSSGGEGSGSSRGRGTSGSTAVESRPSDTVGVLPGSNPSTQSPSLNTSPTSPKAAEPYYISSRPYRRFPPSKLLHSLTAGTLRGPGRFAVPPLIVAKTTAGAAAEGGHEGDAYAFIHLGRSLCGHDGIIHGGLLATICDEAFARTAFFSLPSKVGVTARLELDYKSPTMADQFVVIKTELIEAKGRKAIVKGEIRNMAGKLLVEGRAIFVEPKFAKFLDTSLVRDAMDTDQ